jgi:hypothetical protein
VVLAWFDLKQRYVESALSNLDQPLPHGRGPFP